jgi:hypothetical protein
VYLYKTMDSKKVQDIEKFANDQITQGWELIQVVTAQDRYVSVFRKPKA